MASERYLKRKAGRLKREIARIDRFFYLQDEGKDLGQLAGMLERKRDDVVRSAVLQLHTASEDLLNLLIIHRVLNAESATRVRKLRTVTGRALHKMLYGGNSLPFEMKLNLALAHRVITSTVRDRLLVLNTLRNRCSHNWILTERMRRGRRPAQKKPPLLRYNDRDLHSPDVFEDFCSEYGMVHVNLFLKL
jgi:hypothetical protein